MDPAEFPQPEKPKIVRSVVMFFITLCSVFLVYGFQWSGGNPLTDVDVAIRSIQFAIGLMTILLCHEMGHYIVAKRHGFSISEPYFLPFPFAFGTLGAVIQLKSLPKNRTALLEMGAAGPIAGFVAAIFWLLLDLSSTKNYAQVHLSVPREEIEEALQTMVQVEPNYLEKMIQTWGLISAPSTESIDIFIMSDPLLFQWVTTVALGQELSPYAELGPWAFAAWVGCLITFINLLPIGQLDGGHIVNALFPSKAQTISKVLLGCAIVAGIFWWHGWLVWALLLYFLKAYRSIYIPSKAELSTRAKIIAGIIVCVFVLSAMPRPIYNTSVQLDDIIWQHVEK